MYVNNILNQRSDYRTDEREPKCYVNARADVTSDLLIVAITNQSRAFDVNHRTGYDSNSKRVPQSSTKDGLRYSLMMRRLHYGTTAKVFHWLIVGLLVLQYPIGWLMPDIHRGQQPGVGMNLHISFGISILILVMLRFVWRLTHPVAPESSLPPWQRLSSELLHWMLYALVLATTFSGWLFASFRGWSVSFFYLVPLPMLAGNNGAAGKAIDGLHQAAEWTLLILVGLHVLAALTHMFIYRDRIMQRMLPG